MDLIFATNARFTRASNGHIYGVNTSINYFSFQHYLSNFENIYILARVENSDEVFNAELRIDKDRIQILEVPYFQGAIQFIKKQKVITKAIAKFLILDAAVICRVPGAIGRIAANELLKIKKPFAIEVAGDPQDIFASGVFRHPLRSLIRKHGIFHLKKLAKKASAVLYVTKSALQQRYPATPGIFTTYASNVILKNDAFANSSKKFISKKTFKIVCIGTLDQMYKGPDVLLKSLKIVCNKGQNVQLIWVGGGRYLKSMHLLAKELEISKEVNFIGIIKPANKVREIIDSADIFVLPSRTEGLPRAMVEAMARGIPCIGTNVGGIPELLDEDLLVPINSYNLLAEKIQYLLSNPTIYNSVAEKNLLNSREYFFKILNSRRTQFYQKIIELTEKYTN
ncbi:MAG: glycosyltransferase family 4 protein [Cyclobacteriaceae bacterium]|nr:glycosyltransferase family 4 protein [Cyclobacteriaceae bacterium]